MKTLPELLASLRGRITREEITKDITVTEIVAAGGITTSGARDLLASENWSGSSREPCEEWSPSDGPKFQPDDPA